MALDREQIARFDVSLARCLADQAFLTRFYDLFVATSPEVAEKFRGTDFRRQRRATAASLYVIVLALEQGEAATIYMNQIARQHGRDDLDIPPEMYDPWRDCLLQAVREFDPLFNDELERTWVEVADFAIAFMRERY
jgi:hemoglobin-like flavoprotein